MTSARRPLGRRAGRNGVCRRLRRTVRLREAPHDGSADPRSEELDTILLFSESASRFVVEVQPSDRAAWEKVAAGGQCAAGPTWAKSPAHSACNCTSQPGARSIGSSTCRSASSRKRGKSRCGGKARLALLLHEPLAVELDLSGDEVARRLSKAAGIERLDRPRGVKGEARLSIATSARSGQSRSALSIRPFAFGQSEQHARIEQGF